MAAPSEQQTTIFTRMTALAEQTGAVNLGQGLGRAERDLDLTVRVQFDAVAAALVLRDRAA